MTATAGQLLQTSPGSNTTWTTKAGHTAPVRLTSRPVMVACLMLVNSSTSKACLSKKQVFGNPVLNWPLGFNGVGLGLRGKPGEPFDYSDDDGDGLPDASDITNDGWFEPGENWGDWGIDGQPAVLLGGAPGAPIPVVGGHIDGGDADLGDLSTVRSLPTLSTSQLPTTVSATACGLVPPVMDSHGGSLVMIRMAPATPP